MLCAFYVANLRAAACEKLSQDEAPGSHGHMASTSHYAKENNQRVVAPLGSLVPYNLIKPIYYQ